MLCNPRKTFFKATCCFPKVSLTLIKDKLELVSLLNRWEYRSCSSHFLSFVSSLKNLQKKKKKKSLINVLLKVLHDPPPGLISCLSPLHPFHSISASLLAELSPQGLYTSHSLCLKTLLSWIYMGSKNSLHFFSNKTEHQTQWNFEECINIKICKKRKYLIIGQRIIKNEKGKVIAMQAKSSEPAA